MTFIVNEEIAHIVTPALETGETLLWANKSRNVSYDYTALIGLVIALGLVYYLLGDALIPPLKQLTADTPIVFVPVTLFVLALAWQIRAIFLPAHQVFAITDRRVLVWQRLWPRSKKDLQLKNLSKIACSRTGEKNNILLWFTAKGFRTAKQDVGLPIIKFPFFKAGGFQLHGIEEPEKLIELLQKHRLRNLK